MFLHITEADTKKRIEHQAAASARAQQAEANPGLGRAQLTPTLVKKIEEKLRDCEHWKVDFSTNTATQLISTVKFGPNLTQRQRFSVKIDGDGVADIQCCGLEKEFAHPCPHVLVGLDRASKIRNSVWTPYDKRLFNNVWHTETWNKQYGAEAVSLSIDIAQLERDESIRPWREPPRVGRPPAKRPFKKIEGRKYKTCLGCGEEGHNVRSCVQIDLDLYYNNLTRGTDAAWEEEGDDDMEEDLPTDEDLEEGELDDLLEDAKKPKKRSRGQETVTIMMQAQEHPDQPRSSRRKQ